jgi:hypothetical protein
MPTQSDALRAKLLKDLGAKLQEEREILESERDRTVYSLAKRKGVVQGLKLACEIVDEIFKDVTAIYEGS